MANYDSGHYFLTALIPLRNATLDVDGRRVSPRQRVEELLAVLPNAEWLPAGALGNTEELFSPCSVSPFVREARTHFTRLVVIDDLPYNARQPADALLDLLRKRDPLVPQPVETLGCAWLLWCADFDAASGADSERDSWLASVWQNLGSELTPILRHAVGFEDVHDAAGFTRYIARCQVETTLPFNDYWAVMPALSDVGFRIPLLLAVAGLVCLLMSGYRLAGLALLVLAVLWAWLSVRNAGLRPFPAPQPPAPPSTLPSVRKALYVQQAFSAFVADSQALDAETLHARFGAFVAQHRPEALDAPSQALGQLGL